MDCGTGFGRARQVLPSNCQRNNYIITARASRWVENRLGRWDWAGQFRHAGTDPVLHCVESPVLYREERISPPRVCTGRDVSDGIPIRGVHGPSLNGEERVPLADVGPAATIGQDPTIPGVHCAALDRMKGVAPHDVGATQTLRGRRPVHDVGSTRLAGLDLSVRVPRRSERRSAEDGHERIVGHTDGFSVSEDIGHGRCGATQGRGEELS
jgi:hypothetical protein